MQKISKTLYNLSTTKATIIAIIIFMIVMAFALPKFTEYNNKAVGEDTPDTAFGYSADDMYDMAEEYGAEGRRMYIVLRFTFDLVYPLVYMFFMVTVLSKLMSCLPETSRWRNLNILPLIGGVFDYLENTGASIVMARFPDKTPIIAELTPIMSILKWGLLGLSFVLIAVFGVYRLGRFLQGKKR